VTFHEFSHQLDHEDGPTDGAPPLSSREAYRSWAWTFGHSYKALHADLSARRKTLLNSYAATNPAEFFAVATEAFFEKPRQMAKKMPLLYEELKSFYEVDPQQWFVAFK
jgi:Mlc titration factor MtfA (ptsG expression regulator)